MRTAMWLIAASIGLCPHLAAAGDADPPPIELKEIPQARVIYRVRNGPYWRLGDAFAEIGRILADHPDAGPMFGRYLDDPKRVQPSRLRTEVGFFAPADIDVPDGYISKTVAAHQAAILVVTAPYASAPQHHRRVLDWVRDQGYTAAGEITEVYPRPAGRQPVIEIRVPIRPPAPDRPTPVSLVEPRETAPLDQLLKAREFARVAARVIPATAYLPTRHRRWLAEIADRLRVIREIVDTRYAGEPATVHDLLTPIVDRAERLRSNPPQDGMRGDAATPLADRRLAGPETRALKSLDRLMVQAHLKKLTATEIYDALVVTLTDVDRILTANAEWKVPDEGVGDPP